MFGYARVRAGRGKGVAVIWTALLIVGMIGMAAAVCDIGYVMMVGSQLQCAADAAALAAAFKLANAYSQGPSYDPAALWKAAQDIARKNYADKKQVILRDNPGNSADGDIVIGTFSDKTKPPTFTPGLVEPNAVKVMARRTGAVAAGPLPLLFAPVLGFTRMDVERLAIASLEPGIRDVVHVLKPTGQSTLDMQGSAWINAIGGDVVVNSDDANAATSNGHKARIDANSVRLLNSANPGEMEFCHARIRRIDERLSDPLAGVAEPDWSQAKLNPEPSPTGKVIEYPTSGGTHYFPNGITVDSKIKTMTIKTSGIYVLGPPGLRIHANGALITDDGVGVLFYLPADPNAAPGQEAHLQVDANGSLVIKGIVGGAYDRIVIWQARGNDEDSNLGGGGNIDIRGVIYMPDAPLSYSGNATTVSTQLIVWTLSLAGDATLRIPFDGYPIPWACLVQ